MIRLYHNLRKVLLKYFRKRITLKKIFDNDQQYNDKQYHCDILKKVAQKSINLYFLKNNLWETQCFRWIFFFKHQIIKSNFIFCFNCEYHLRKLLTNVKLNLHYYKYNIFWYRQFSSVKENCSFLILYTNLSAKKLKPCPPWRLKFLTWKVKQLISLLFFFLLLTFMLLIVIIIN